MPLVVLLLSVFLYASSSTDDGSKRRVVKNQGEDVFAKLALPQAILRFKQGFGRLIRTSTDTGTVFVLDRRLTSASYGKRFYNQFQLFRFMKASRRIVRTIKGTAN